MPASRGWTRYGKRLIAAVVFAGVVSLLLLRQYIPILGSLGIQVQEHPTHQVLLIRLLLIFVGMLIISSWVFVGWNTVNEWLHRYRWWIGACVVFASTLLNLSGSSLNIWNAFMSLDQQENTVFGVPRVMRSDEYATTTLFAFSQQYNDYGWFNNIIGNRASNMYIVKDAPIFSFAEIFRPFHWGYLLFGPERGLAFYWASRFVVLFLVTYEFFMLVTKSPRGESTKQLACQQMGNRGISVFCAILISFSPLIQWWFAINNLVEMIIDVFAATLLFDKYLSTHESLLRGIYAICILLCAGSFIWTLYPAWQIPMGYVLIALIIWQLHEHWKSTRLSVLDWIVLAVLGVVFLATMVYIAYRSRDAIQALLNTSYPGDRRCPGGDDANCPGGGVSLLTLFGTSSNLGLAFAARGDAPELGYIIDFAPLGITLAVINMIVNKKKRFDILSITSMILVIVLFVYSTNGLPLAVANGLGLSLSTSKRATVGLELLNLILLSRAITRREWEIKRTLASAVSIAVAGLFVWLAVIQMNVILENPKQIIIIIIGLLTFVMYSAVCWICIGLSAKDNVLWTSDTMFGCLRRQYSTHVARLYACLCALTVFCLAFAGVCVNPIQWGSDAITKQPIILAARSVEDSGNPGIWMAEGNRSGQISNLLAANGLTTISATQVYPNQTLWKKLDPSQKLLYRHNRYAYIEVVATNKQLPLSKQIKVLHPDVIQLTLNSSQLANLGVTYLVSDKDLSQYSNDDHVFTQISVREGGYAVWHLS